MESVIRILLEQISAYELLNSFIPGAVFAILAERLTSFSVLSGNAFADIIEFYFFGLLIGRIGSVIVESALKRLKHGKWIEQPSYAEYVTAEKSDDSGKVRMLSMINNMYRTFVAAFLCLLATVLLDLCWPLVSTIIWLKTLIVILGCLLLTLIFTYSYKKQTEYVAKRVSVVLEHTKNNQEKNSEKNRLQS